jgi:hypothetical protein
MGRFAAGCRARVILPYQAQYSDAIKMRIGDDLIPGRKDNQWPGWIWCTAPSGKSGWVPERNIYVDGDTCRALVDYDASELTVEIGDELILLEQESGWFWAHKQNGQKGWIPVEHMEIIEV